MCVTHAVEAAPTQISSPTMDSSPRRRRRERPACSCKGRKQKVVICAYLGIGLSARTIITPTEAWSSLAPISVRNGHPVPIWGNMAASPGIFTSKPSANLFESRFGNSGRTKQYAFEQQSRRIHSVGRGAEGRSAALSSSGNDRSSIRPLMSMAGEGGSGGGGGGGTDSARQNAVLGALTVAGFGAVYYAMHEHGGGVGAGAVSSAPFHAILETAKAGPAEAKSIFQTFLASSVSKVDDLGPLGPFYFGALYVLAEVLIIPAIPLSTAAGFLFGVGGGTAVVLGSATIAAAISFQLGRTLLRQQVEGLLEENPKFRAIDNAIAKEGFKIILLLRLSPIFPFALSNYLYGVTSVKFTEYLVGTMIGFLPGTVAYVYGGTLGKALTDGGSGGMSLPWYGYVAGAAGVAFILKTVGDIATSAIEELEPGMRDE